VTKIVQTDFQVLLLMDFYEEYAKVWRPASDFKLLVMSLTGIQGFGSPVVSIGELGA
jgi:hypothetical protein